MSSVCRCGKNGLNSGVGKCPPIAKRARKVYFSYELDETGAKNYVPKGTEIDQTFLDDMINHVNPRKRWYPIPYRMKNVSDLRADAIYDEDDEGVKDFVRDGVKSFSTQINRLPQRWGKFIKAINCEEMAAYVVDCDKQLIGQSPDCGNLYPTPIAKGTINSVPLSQEGATVPKTTISWDWRDDAKDECIGIIKSADITADILNGMGLLDVTSVLANGTIGVEVTSATQVKVRAQDIFCESVEGLDQPDFIAHNTSTDTPIAIATVLEGPDPGCYTITFAAAVPSGENFYVGGSKLGFSFGLMEEISNVAP